MKNSILLISITLLTISNSTAQWTKIGAVPTQSIVALATIADTILAVSNRNILYKSADNGVTWDSIVISNNPIVPIVLKVIDNKIYIGTSGSGIFSSADFGVSWQHSGSNLLPISGIDKKGNDLYATTLGGGIYIFNQAGNNWLPFNNLLPTYSVNVFAIASTSNALLIAAGANGTFYNYNFSTNSWDEGFYSGSLRPGLRIEKLINDSDIIFAVNGSRILKSQDDGLTWQDDKVGTHDGYARSMCIGEDYHFTATNKLNGGTWIQQRSRYAVTGVSWAINEEFLGKGFTYDILEFRNKIFLAKDDGLYIKNISLGIANPYSNNAEIDLYPNPSVDSDINISSNVQINKVVLINSEGHIAYSETINKSNFSIHPGLERGIYFMNLISPKGQNTVRKIIVE